MPNADRTIGLHADAVLAAASRIGEHADELRNTYFTTRAQLDDALYGCVGRSLEELSALSDRWAAVETRHGERLDALSRHVRAAAVTLTETDHRNAARVARVNDDSSGRV